VFIRIWYKTQADLHFPEAVAILDWPHVARAVHKAIRVACPGAAQRARRRELHQQIPDALWHADLPGALAQLQALRPPGSAESVAVLEDTLRYLEGQRAWLGNYQAWQAAGYPVGSGLIERAVAIVINWRMKRRGMRWWRANASAVVALRVRELNAHWEPDPPQSPLAAYPPLWGGTAACPLHQGPRDGAEHDLTLPSRTPRDAASGAGAPTDARLP
jgi:hypothetical protein